MERDVIIQKTKGDLFRYTGYTDKKTFIKTFCRNRVFRFLTIFRLWDSDKLRLLFKFLWKLNSTKRLIQITPGMQVGGLLIVHYAPVFVNPSAIIGDNCTISQNVTVGSNCDKAAVIGNNVYIGPNVCVVENVKIGDNVTIGAGSVVTKDIPSNATAVGNYAKVINYNNPGKCIDNIFHF